MLGCHIYAHVVKALIFTDTLSQMNSRAPKRTASGEKKEALPAHGVIGWHISKSKNVSKSVVAKASNKMPRTKDFIKSEAVDSGCDDSMDIDGLLGTAEKYEALRDPTSNDEMFSLDDYDNDDANDL